MANHYGTDAGEDLKGGNFSDEIYGYGGDDTIDGGKGGDIIYGGAGNDFIDGGEGDDSIDGGVGNDIIDGGSGNNTLHGGEGADYFCVGAGTDLITDYAPEDAIFAEESGSGEARRIVGATLNEQDIVFSIKDTWTSNPSNPYPNSVTVANAADKTITFMRNDWDGTKNVAFAGYTMTKTALTLLKSFGGTAVCADWYSNDGRTNDWHTLDARNFLSTVTKIDGSAATKTTVLYGNGNANTITGGSGNDTLYGLGGNDTLNGGKGNDVLEGGTGSDVFVYRDGDGIDTVNDYEQGEDTVYIAKGAVKSATVSGSNLIFAVGKGKVTLKNAATKTVSMKDGRGSYMMSKTGLTLSSNFGGTVTAAQYFSTVKTVNGKSATRALKLSGNAQANTITGGKGNDVLTGGAGKDTFAYANGTGKDTVSDFAAGEMLYVTSGTISKTMLANKNKDLVFTVGKGNVTLKNAAAKSIALKDSRGNYSMSKSSLSLSSNFTGSLNSAYYLSTITTINGNNAKKTVTLYGNGKNNTINGGQVADKLYGRAGNDKIYGNGGNDYLYGEAGNDSLYGGAGLDYLSGAAGNDYLDGGASNDKLYGGAGNDKLYGSAGNDYLYGEAGNDYLNGGADTDYLYGGAGNDTLYGGAGNDTFVYAKNTGKDVISDFNKSGTDTLYINSGAISKTAVSGSNMVFTVGSGTVTLTGAGSKTITVRDSRGTYTLNKSSLVLTNTFKGSLSAANYLSTITTINGSKAVNAVTLTGNAKNNVINGGSKNDTIKGGAGNDKLYGNAGNDSIEGGAGVDYLYGGAGNDKLYGGDGNDVLYAGTGTDYLYGGNGNDVLYANAGTSYLYGQGGTDTFVVDANTTQNVFIYDFTAGTDKLKVLNSSNVKVKVSGSNLILTMGKSTVTLKNMTGKLLDIYNASGKVIRVQLNSGSQQSVIKNFMKILDSTAISLTNRFVNINNDGTYLDAGIVNALNQAVRYASNGLYWTWSELINGNYDNGNAEDDGIITRLSKYLSDGGTAKGFLLNHCGIDLDNDDTGAITGKDAGGTRKTAESIVPESGSLKALPKPNTTSSTIEGATFKWVYNSNDARQRAVVQRLNTWWMEEGLKLIKTSYGMSFTNADIKEAVKNIVVQFVDSASKSYVGLTNHSWDGYGRTSKLKITINMYYYADVISDVNGIPRTEGKDYSQACYMDRLLAHELTHAVMAATIRYFGYLPTYLKEGAAELVHGIDDERTDDILDLAGSAVRLSNALKNYDSASHDNYAGGYMLLRYLAYQVARVNDNGGVQFSWGSSASASKTSASASTVSSAKLLTDSSAMLVGSADAQLSSLVSATTTDSLGALTTPGAGLASVDVSGSSLVAANGTDVNNTLTNKNKVV